MIQNMNQFSTNRPTPAPCSRPCGSAFSVSRSSSLAFTLIELLVVIAIIGLLAALIVSGAGTATIKARTYRVQAERDALITAIQQYKNHKGYYPPDNTNNPAINTLFYELTGTAITNNNFVSASGDVLTPAEVTNVFGVGGFINSSSDPTQPADNFFKAAGNSTRTATFFVSASAGDTFTLFGVPVPPGYSSTAFPYNGVPGKNARPTLWNYVATNPTNNSSEFDLWMDVTWSGKTNRISNWSKDPQVMH
jgi:prepilin-type N-terminal cleavage/methylation domain-containing protein